MKKSWNSDQNSGEIQIFFRRFKVESEGKRFRANAFQVGFPWCDFTAVTIFSALDLDKKGIKIRSPRLWSLSELAGKFETYEKNCYVHTNLYKEHVTFSTPKAYPWTVQACIS